jgi:hypothetical protein
MALGGTITPGRGENEIDTLYIIGNVDIGATNATFHVDINGGGSLYDALSVTGGNVLVGTANLSVSLNFTPTNGQKFTIIQQHGTGDVSGQFAQGTNIVLGGRNFAVSYSASNIVLTAPTPTLTGFSLQPGGAGLVMHGFNGAPTSSFTVLSSTNLSLPVTNWQVVATPVFDLTGAFSVTNTINPALPQQFLTIRSP